MLVDAGWDCIGSFKNCNTLLAQWLMLKLWSTRILCFLFTNTINSRGRAYLLIVHLIFCCLNTEPGISCHWTTYCWIGSNIQVYQDFFWTARLVLPIHFRFVTFVTLWNIFSIPFSKTFFFNVKKHWARDKMLGYPIA